MSGSKIRVVNRRAAILLASLAVLSGTQSAHAVIKTWVGGSPSGNYFDVAGNWNTSGAPGAADTALFNLAGTYESVFDSITGNVTNNFLDVEAGNLSFRHDAGPLNTYTTGLMTVDNGASFSLINLMKVVSTGDLNVNRGSSITVNVLSTYQNTATMRLGSGGTSAENKLIINNGGTVNSNAVDLGEVAGTNARATLSGANATWNITNSLYAGISGNGILEVTNGADVICDTSFLGYSIGGVGTATVTGADSIWTNTYNLSLGDNTASGVGNLTISSGGRINVGDGAAAIPPDGYSYIDDTSANASAGGTLYVYNGSTFTNDTGISVARTAGHSGRIVVSGTGSTFNAGQFSYIGDGGTGILNISAGGKFITTLGTAVGSGGTGTVTIDGNGSSLQDQANLSLGGGGVGTVTTTNGGSIYVGDSATAAGSLNGYLIIDDVQAIGAGAGGKLTIANGSTLTHAGIAILGAFSGKSGELLITGTDSKLSVTTDMSIGSVGRGVATVTGTNAKLEVGSNLAVGVASSSANTLTVSAGGLAQSTFQTILSQSTGSNSTVTVTGTNSMLAVGSELEVGRAGTATLNVNSAGKVTAVNTIVGKNTGGSGTVTLSGTNSLIDLTGDLTIGQSSGGTGTFTTSSSANLHVGDGPLTGIGNSVVIVSDTNAGGASGGNLKIANGSTFNHTAGSWAVMGFNTGEWGKMTVSGTNSSFNGNGDIVVGRAGTGVLDINTGGSATANASFNAGMFTGGTGTITVAGSNSLLWAKTNATLNQASTITLSSGGDLRVGDRTDNATNYDVYVSDIDPIGTNGGVLSIFSGSQLTSSLNASIGTFSGQSGRVVVSGVGSKWTGAGFLMLGYDTGSVGEAQVSSQGLVSASILAVGNGGTGTLTISSSGQVTAGSLILASLTGGSGTINLNNTGSLLQVNGNINLGNNGPGTIVVDGGTLTQTGSSTLNIGSATSGSSFLYLINSASSNVTTGSLGTNIHSSGTIQMSAGTFTTTTLQNNGLVNASPGTININGATGTGNIQLFNATLNSTSKGIVQDTMNIAGTSTATIGANGTSTGVSKIKSLTIAPNAKLELHDNDLILDYTGGSSPYTTVFNKVKSGLTLLGGTGKGIASTEVDAQTIPGTVLAVVDNGAIGGEITSTSGFAVPAQSVIVKYTWFGDCNLDGVVNGDDYALTDTGFVSGGSLTGWIFGDMNFDGVVTGDDYALVDTGFIFQTGALPEPANIGLLIAGLSFIHRRRVKPRF